MSYDSDTYTNREIGYSPEPIRSAVWSLYASTAKGDVLDIGVGGGEWTRRLMAVPSVSSVSGIDLVDDGAGAIDGLDFRLCDLSTQRLPFDDATFDEVYALEVLEHLANPRHALAEVQRVLRSGGRFIVSTPCVDSVRAKVWYAARGYFPAFGGDDYRTAGHITPISRFDLHRMAHEAGFATVEESYPLPGLIPGVGRTWQQFVPRLRGAAWSDCLMAELRT